MVARKSRPAVGKGQLRVLSWNLNARRAVDRQAEAVAALAPDVGTFQELTPATWAALRPLLATIGLPHAVSGRDLARDGYVPRLPRFVAVASRWPLSPCEPAPVPVPEVVACVTVAAPSGSFEFIGLHLPNATKEPPLKIETQEGIAARIATASRPVVVAGDFNSPRAELPDGTVVPFTGPRLLRARAAELGMITGLAGIGLADCYRACRGYTCADSSWFWKNRGRTGGYRLDHIFASEPFTPAACWYEHSLRKSNLSDHSPIVADLHFP